MLWRRAGATRQRGTLMKGGADLHFFTSDLHLGDPNILRHENRPFTSVDAMTDAIIANCRARLTKKDDLWIVGDFVRGADAELAERFFGEVPGRKHLIVGNHDRRTIQALPGWTTVTAMMEMKADGQPVTLCHYPLMTWNGAARGADATSEERLSIQIFGYVHGQTSGWWRAVNVSVELWDYGPASIDEIVARSESNFFAVPMHEAQFPTRRPAGPRGCVKRLIR